MEAVRAQAATAEQIRSTDLSNRTEKLVGGLSDQVQDLLKSVADQVAATQRNIDAIGSVTTRAIEGMNSGALTMGSAARQFETAGNSVTSVFERSGKVADQLTEVATSLQTAATAVRHGFEQYDQTRKTVDANVQALTALIESTKREAGLTKQMITDLERIVAQLRTAEEQTKVYLEGVNKALETAFNSFGSSLLTSVKNSIGETDRHLSSGVQQLNGVVQEIGVAISRLRKG
jgi:methyl-accepting chemotaxis protein